MSLFQSFITMYIPNEYPSWCTSIFLITIILCIIIYSIHLFSKSKCPTNIPRTNIRGIPANYQYMNEYLCNFIIKSSHASCTLGNFKNDYVNLCMLESVIKQGCRFLDFEIYAVDNKPVVATSTLKSNYEKGSFNSIELSHVLKCVYDKAISPINQGKPSCPNAYDPLFLHFRLKTSIKEVYNAIASDISTILSSVLLSNDYNLDNMSNYSNNLWKTLKLQDVMGKVIIIVDKIDSVVQDSHLYEIVNINSSDVNTNLIRTNDITYTMTNGTTPSNVYYTEPNQDKMTVVLPTIHQRPMNYDAVKCFSLGIQICTMCFQKKDKLLDKYNKQFNERQSAFIIKNYFNPDVDLYRPVAVTSMPTLQNNNVSVQMTTESNRVMPSNTIVFK